MRNKMFSGAVQRLSGLVKWRLLFVISVIVSCYSLGDVLVKESFEETSLRGWRIAGGSWCVDNGVLSGGGGQPAAKLINNVIDLSDFELTVDIRIKSQGTQAGVIFRSSDVKTVVDGYNGYYSGIHAGKNMVIWGASQNQWQEIARKPSLIKAGEWYRLRLRMSGNHLVMFVNDIPVAEGRYPKVDGVNELFENGGFAFRVLGGYADFKDLKISSYKESRLKRSYTNPVNAGAGCADPVVFKDKGLYYAYCTYSPDFPRMVNGIRLYSSKDLVNWDDHGYVLTNENSWGSSRFWAPDIAKRGDTYYLYYGADERSCVATAKSPKGPFVQIRKEPLQPKSIRIDAHIFKDDDEQYYIYYVHFNRGNEIWAGKLNDDMVSVDESTLRMMVKPGQPWEKFNGNVTEGPEVIKHKGIYYLTYSGSHFENPNYAVGYAISDSPMGPWKKYEFNPIMKSTAYAHGTAHHSLTSSMDGKQMYIVYHRHFSLNKTEPRQMSVDRIQFVEQSGGPDVLEVWGPTSSPQPMPR